MFRLSEYKRKRRFDETAEPKGPGVAPRPFHTLSRASGVCADTSPSCYELSGPKGWHRVNAK
jgi:hypothetical protein